MNIKYKMNKKGVIGAFAMVLIFLGLILVAFLGMGGIAGSILKNTFERIPTLFWVGIVLFVLIILTKKKK